MTVPALSPALRAAGDDAPLDMLGYADWSDIEAAIDRITDEVIAEQAGRELTTDRREWTDA